MNNFIGQTRNSFNTSSVWVQHEMTNSDYGIWGKDLTKFGVSISDIALSFQFMGHSKMDKFTYNPTTLFTWAAKVGGMWAGAGAIVLALAKGLNKKSWKNAQAAEEEGTGGRTQSSWSVGANTAAVGSNFGAKGPWADTDVANTARQESAGLESMSRGLTAKDPDGATPAGQVGFDPSMKAP